VLLLVRIVEMKFVETVLTLGVVKSHVEVLLTSYRCINVTIYWAEGRLYLCVRVNTVFVAFCEFRAVQKFGFRLVLK